MLEMHWTMESWALLVAGILTAIVLGYLLAVVVQGRKRAQLLAQLQNYQLEENTLTQQLDFAQATQQRLEHELLDNKQSSTELQSRLELAQRQQHSAEKQLEVAQAHSSSLKEQLNVLKQQLQTAKDEYTQLQARNQSLSNQYTELKTSLARKEEHFQEQMQQLNDSKLLLSKEFENLANKIFEEKSKAFTHSNQTSIDALLKPFREQIEGFQKRVNDVHDASLQGNTQLNAEIRKVLDIGLKMSQEASDLSKALKGDSQQRGAWGEAQLKRTLEMSGLIEDAHYEVQSAFKDADGKHKQTDYLVKLPDDKHIIIDSKVTLNAYERVVTAQTPEELLLAMNEHVKAVRKHIDDLAAKDYTNLIGMHSPGFVLMFMPIEPAYIEALKHSKDLFEYGYKKGIVLVSHTTLIPILRTVSNLWMIERSNAEAREISERAGDIYNQVCTVAERLAKLGHTLGTVSKHYNSTVTALAGQQGLYGKVERFNQLSVKVSKTLPQLEPAHMDFETERLGMIVEPIHEVDTLLAEPDTSPQP